MPIPRWRNQYPPQTPLARVIASREKRPYCFSNHRVPAIVCPRCAWEADCKAAKGVDDAEKGTEG